VTKAELDLPDSLVKVAKLELRDQLEQQDLLEQRDNKVPLESPELSVQLGLLDQLERLVLSA